jgi:type II secretory ATPase GspE/PulE/Tfp pilus assembly ATPase PilB-like protein
VYEILTVDPALNDLIRARADSKQIRAAAGRAGFTSLLDDALAKAVAGLTSLDEVLRVAYE